MVDYDSMTENEDPNVLTYIYKLRSHLNNLKLFWQGLGKDSKGKLIRISAPIAADDFIFTTIGALESVLNPHNFVSQLGRTEKNDMLLDTFTAFIHSALREKDFNWDKFQLACQTYYNTLHLFLNLLEGAFGGQLTAAIQSGITSNIPRNQEVQEVTPYVDIGSVFGMNKPAVNNQVQPRHPNQNFNQNRNNQYDDYDYEQ